MQDQLNQLREALKANLDNPEFLSRAIIELSSLNLTVGMLSGQARFNQEESTIRFMDSMASMSDKKMSKTEAESRAIIATNNEYEILQNQREDIQELVNSIKSRINVLSWDIKHS